MRKAFYTVLLILIISIVINVLLWLRCKQKEDKEIERETVIDTLYYRQPVPVDSIVVRQETKVVPIFKPQGTNVADVIHDTVQPIVMIKEDSAQIVIPITQKIYEDSTYRAYVSGYKPSLDSIQILSFTERVTVRSPVKQPRFSLGLQGGYGYTPKGFQPYIGIGINLNLWSF